MSSNKQYLSTLKKLKSNNIRIPVDGRRSLKTMTPAEKSRITKMANKFSHVIEGHYVKKHVGKKTADTLENNYGHRRQGNNIWLPTNGGKGNELLTIKIKTTKEAVEIERTFSSGKRTIETPLHDVTNFYTYAEKRFNGLGYDQSLTVQIGDSHAWKNRNFGSLEQLNNYMPDFYQMVSERDGWENSTEVEAALSPLISLVDFIAY